MRTVRALASALCLCLATVTLVAQAPQPAPAPAADACARVWVGHESDYETYLKSAKVTSMKEIGLGVTRPNRAYLEPGGLVASMTWKPITPGMKNGFYESYRSEVAAYELDKLLQLGMVPPTIERDLERKTGAAVMWVSPSRSFKDMGGVPGQPGVPGPPPARAVDWTRQVIKAKMFDNLIANKDPNLGNWLVDGDWHLLLIDHTRSFTAMKTMIHKMDNIDGPLWERFKALDEPALKQAVGAWMGGAEVRAILERRDRMQKDIDSLVKARGDSVILK